MFNLGLNIPDNDLISQLETNSKKKFGETDIELIKQIAESGEIDMNYYSEKLISFSSVVKGMRNVTSKDYIKAIQYCSYIVSNDTQVSAYRKTFPDRVANKKADGTIRASANQYHNSELVTRILSLAQVPAHLMFMSERVEAIGKLTDLMRNADSQRVQMESADKLLSHIKPPEESKLTLDVNVRNEAVQSLDAKLTQLAQHHVSMASNGEITAHDIVDAEFVKE